MKACKTLLQVRRKEKQTGPFAFPWTPVENQIFAKLIIRDNLVVIELYVFVLAFFIFFIFYHWAYLVSTGLY